MSFLDSIRDKARKAIPQNLHGSIPAVASSSVNGGIAFDDEMPISKPAIVFHSLQVFFAFIAMCCFASVASFQAKWKVGPSGLSGFAIFCAVTNLLLALFLVLVPVIYDKYNKMIRLSRALKELRVAFILTGAGVLETLLISFTGTISAWTQPGCKNPDKDPNAKTGGDDYKKALPGWCSTKKAGSVFFWFCFAAWVASFVLVVLDWRSGKAVGGRRPRDPPFRHPEHDDAESIVSRRPTHLGRRGRDEDDDEDDNPIQSPFADPQYRYSAPTAPQGRASMDAYGAFSESAPSGYADGGRDGSPLARPPPASSYYDPPQPAFQSAVAPNPSAGMSRTMALAYEDTGTSNNTYEDPYERVRASLGPGPQKQAAAPPYDYRLS